MANVIINGVNDRLEACYHQSANENAPIALILHPDPRFKGNMNNSVVLALYNECVNLGFSVLRFNFVGIRARSGAKAEESGGELLEAACALDWLQRNHPSAKHCWVMGFSFGAYVAMQVLMRRPEIFRFVIVAPPYQLYDFSFLAPCPTSGLLVSGGKDIVAPKEHMRMLVASLRQQKSIQVDYQCLEGASHFFENSLQELRRIVHEYVQKEHAH